jgi:hypothetical protein
VKTGVPTQDALSYVILESEQGPSVECGVVAFDETDHGQEAIVEDVHPASMAQVKTQLTQVYLAPPPNRREC